MIKIFKSWSTYHAAIAAGQFTEFNVSAGWAATYAGLGRTAIHLSAERGHIDALKILSAGERHPIVLYSEQQIRNKWSKATKVA